MPLGRFFRRRPLLAFPRQSSSRNRSRNQAASGQPRRSHGVGPYHSGRWALVRVLGSFPPASIEEMRTTRETRVSLQLSVTSGTRLCGDTPVGCDIDPHILHGARDFQSPAGSCATKARGTTELLGQTVRLRFGHPGGPAAREHGNRPGQISPTGEPDGGYSPAAITGRPRGTLQNSERPGSRAIGLPLHR
jgi:hypothetical protein